MPDGIIDLLQSEHTLIDPKLAYLPVHMSIMSRPLTHETGNLIPILLDEIRHGIYLLRVTNTKNSCLICVFNTMSRFAGQTTVRVFIGVLLCRACGSNVGYRGKRAQVDNLWARRKIVGAAQTPDYRTSCSGRAEVIWDSCSLESGNALFIVVEGIIG
ncbi:hypothetical protein BDV11DRAFT_171776 [Aspergillus similis]